LQQQKKKLSGRTATMIIRIKEKSDSNQHESDYFEDFFLFPQTASLMHWNEELLLPIKSCAAPSEDQFDQLI
jgi:hypothetical protein